MQKYFSKDTIEYWTLGITGVLSFIAQWQSPGTLGSGRNLALQMVILGLFVYLYIHFVRAVALTAEKARRPFVGFMIFAIFMPVLAGIIVIMFKKED